MDAATCRTLFAGRPVAVLATYGREGPHLVPIAFAVEGDTIVSAVDHKPKRTTRLQRLVNIERDPRVAVLADYYADDWRRLWWVRVDGTARTVTAGNQHDAAVDLLVSKYPQYRSPRPNGPVISISIHRWSGWRAVPEQ